MTKQKSLSRWYYNPNLPGSYGGENALKQATKQKNVKSWLMSQDTYTLHKPTRRRFERRRVIVNGIDGQWQADLVDLTKLKKANDNYCFLLTVIDVLSKYAWVRPLKNKTSSVVVNAFEDIIKKDGRLPEALQTDAGKEFTNANFQKMLKSYGVNFFTTFNTEIKAGVIERFNRSFMTKLSRYFTKRKSVRYLEGLPSIVRAYNASYHRSIKFRPKDVTLTNQEEVWRNLYDERPKENKSRQFIVGDKVRISKIKRLFKKGYMETYTREVFQIYKVLQTTPVTYLLKDNQEVILEGTFYKEELQKVR